MAFGDAARPSDLIKSADVLVHTLGMGDHVLSKRVGRDRFVKPSQNSRVPKLTATVIASEARQSRDGNGNCFGIELATSLRSSR